MNLATRACWYITICTLLIEAIKKKYPNPDRSAVCAALDTGILYEYIGDGNWIPISINAIPLASHDNDGLMSSKNYDQLMDCYGRTNIIFFDLNEAYLVTNKIGCYAWKNNEYKATHFLSLSNLNWLIPQGIF